MDDSKQKAEQTRTAADIPPRLGEDEFYRALASSQRRRLLYYLLETTESTVDELATVLSGWEATGSGTLQTQADRSKRQIELRHVHVPLLADAGLVAYDPATGSVELASLHHRVAEVIRRSVAAEDSMSPNDA